MEEVQKTRFKSLIFLHNEFSRAYKAVEPIVEKMDATTLNEARYALRAIIDCIEVVVEEQQDPDKFEEAASAAELALRIVWHDVVDITFDSFRIYLDDLCKLYDPDIVARFIDTKGCAELLAKYEDLAKESRGDRASRAEIYSQITGDHIEKLKTLFNEAKAAEPAIAAAKKKERRDNGFKIFAALASILILCTIVYVNLIKSPDSVSDAISSQEVLEKKK